MYESIFFFQTVAKLTIDRVAGKKPVVSLKLDEKMTGAMPEADWSTTKGEIPQEHKFVVNPVNMQHLAVLSSTRGAGVSGGDKLAVEGKVIQRAECRYVYVANPVTLKSNKYHNSRFSFYFFDIKQLQTMVL